MKNFVKRMVIEHAELTVKLRKLEDYIYSDRSDKDNKKEFANKCIQLKGMRIYEEALRARLVNQGIEFNGSEYYERIDTIDESSSDENTKQLGAQHGN